MWINFKRCICKWFKLAMAINYIMMAILKHSILSWCFTFYYGLHLADAEAVYYVIITSSPIWLCSRNKIVGNYKLRQFNGLLFL